MAGSSRVTQKGGSGDALFGESVTRDRLDLLTGDAGDAGDASSLPLEKKSPLSASVASADPAEDPERVLRHPLVAEAIELFAPEAVEVRLPSGRAWIATRQLEPVDPSSERPRWGLTRKP
jgi:hypothetical protein